MIRTSAVGDVIHALAMVNGLRHGYPDAEITWVLHPVPHEVVREQAAVNRFIVFDKTSLDGWRMLREELRRTLFDVVLVPQVSLKASMVTALARAPVKVGFDLRRSRELHWFFTNHHLPSRPAAHVQDHYFEFLDYLGVEGYEPRWDLTFTTEERQRQASFFTKVGADVVAFVVASSNIDKDWTTAGYAAAVIHVEKVLGLRAMLLGGPSRRERVKVDAILDRCTVEPIVALDRPIRETLLKLDGARVVVAPDTGPLHAAVALGVPTVGLYGLSNPRRCGPYLRFEELLVDHYTDATEASAPVRRTTKRGRMAGISAEEVISKIGLALDRYPARSL